MRKKLIIGLLFLLVAGMSVTFGYMVNQTKTNTIEIKFGSIGDVAELTYQGNYNDVLVPNYITELGENEVTKMHFRLLVTSDTLRNYRIDTDFPEGMLKETDAVASYYTTGTTYNIFIEIDREMDIETFDFYLYINFM